MGRKTGRRKSAGASRGQAVEKTPEKSKQDKSASKAPLPSTSDTHSSTHKRATVPTPDPRTTRNITPNRTLEATLDTTLEATLEGKQKENDSPEKEKQSAIKQRKSIAGISEPNLFQALMICTLRAGPTSGWTGDCQLQSGFKYFNYKPRSQVSYENVQHIELYGGRHPPG
jgi:hypothetical protein